VLRTRLRDVAVERLRYGYRRLHVPLQQEGYQVNHKRIYRLYREEGLAVRRRPRKRVAGGRGSFPLLGLKPNERWCLDFVSDALASGSRIRALAILDSCIREALAIEVDTSLPSGRVAQVLDRMIEERGAPRAIVLDDGPELTSRVLD
jgi:putative transposase